MDTRTNSNNKVNLNTENLEAALSTFISDLVVESATTYPRRYVALQQHTAGTAARIAKTWVEDFWGLRVDPASFLSTTFESDYDQMVVVGKVEFTSWCAHHFLPFFGRYSFAYVPNNRVVGLSKIPRMIEAWCAQPQIQEKLSEDIVGAFYQVLRPHGCGIVMDAVHSCMCARGVNKLATTRTVALRGCFSSNDNSSKQELLSAVGPIPEYR